MLTHNNPSHDVFCFCHIKLYLLECSSNQLQSIIIIIIIRLLLQQQVKLHEQKFSVNLSATCKGMCCD